MKLTEQQMKVYIQKNCKVLTAPRCSECNTTSADVIYHDDLEGNDFCDVCLQDSLEADEGTLERLLAEGEFTE